jgi:PqqD family protein of HPr-rel-A system
MAASRRHQGAAFLARGFGVAEERLGGDLLGPPANHFLLTELDGELTVYDPERSEVHSLNSTATEIWRLLDGKHRFDEVVERFARAHRAEPDAVRPYVAETISNFVDLGLLARRSKD